MSEIQTTLFEGIKIGFLMSLSFSLTTQYSWNSYQYQLPSNSWSDSNNWYPSFDEQLGNSLNQKTEKDICEEKEMGNSINSKIFGDHEYCKLCSDTRHTMCKYGDGPGATCDQPAKGGVTEEQIQEILDAHNHWRRVVASGQESRGNPGPQPNASDMLMMRWDENLAKVAQRWADQCTFGHDKCRDDPRGEVGQNVYVQMKYPDHHDVNWTHAVESWYNEVELFNNTGVPHYIFDSQTGHYTQVVWAKSGLVGCGLRGYGTYPNAIERDPNNPYYKLYVCNYYPSGNWDKEPIYNSNGSACQNCPKSTHCENSLCACGPGDRIYTPQDSQARETDSTTRATSTKRPASERTRRTRHPTTTPSTTTLGNEILPPKTTTESLIDFLNRIIASYSRNRNVRVFRYFY